jgi:hypothetical protein
VRNCHLDDDAAMAADELPAVVGHLITVLSPPQPTTGTWLIIAVHTWLRLARMPGRS